MNAEERKAWEEYIEWVREERKLNRDRWDQAAFAADAELKRLWEMVFIAEGLLNIEGVVPEQFAEEMNQFRELRRRTSGKEA
jgi:hypothetical protein